MQTRFIHAADIHLGYEQYNLAARADDFARAYMGVVEYAVNVHAGFVLLAGDLFHRASADAWMLKQATHGLEQLRRAGIPVVAVEGNHDAQHARKHLSWMQYLCDQELLVLLNIGAAPNEYKALVPWDPECRRGSWIDIDGVRIYGIKYYGARTGSILEEVQTQIEPGPEGYTILMLHAGIQGQVPHLHGGLSPGQLAPLHPPVDYLALGHVHKRLEMDDWIYNPGSTESNSTEEMEWPHGFFDVEVDTSASPIHQVHAIPTPGMRAFHRIAINAEHASSLEEFVALCEYRIAHENAIPTHAVVELYLGGVAQFRRQDVPAERLKAAVESHCSPLTVRLRNDIVPPGLVSVAHGERLKREEIEVRVVEQLVYQQGDYRDQAGAWTRLILEVKNMAAEKTLPAAIADHVRARLSELEVNAGQEGAGIDESEPSLSMATTKVELDPVSSPTTEEAPIGGEPPCMANLFEDW